MFGVIANPVSGGGKSAQIAKQVIEMIVARGGVASLFDTTQEGDGGRQARLAMQAGCDEIVCVGGDGTLSEVVQAMANSGRTLYIVPCGTGNDFARSMNLPKDPLEAFAAQLDGEDTKIDCGSVNGRPFINVSGSGFDVEVLRKTEELKQSYPGEKAYTKAVLAVLGSYQAVRMEISTDDGPFTTCQVTIAEVANGKYFGGGMRVAPAASLQDGLFDLVTVVRVPRYVIPLILPLFKLGVHVYLPVAHVTRAKKIVLRCKGMVVNIDGALASMDEARFEMLPGALDMKLPRLMM